MSPQGPSGKDKELVLGLGHLNNSYNFSVSVWCLQPGPPTAGDPRLSSSFPCPVPRGDRLQGRGRTVQPQLPQLLQLHARPGASI